MVSITLPCNISRGKFSDECAVEVTLNKTHEVHRGLAPVTLCWTSDGRKLLPNQPLPGKKISGRIGARLLRVDGNVALVCIADHQLLRVDKEMVTSRPQKNGAN